MADQCHMPSCTGRCGIKKEKEMKQTSLVVATRKIGDKWHGAVLANDSFMQSIIESSLEVLVQKALVGAFMDAPEGAAVNVNVVRVPPQPKEVESGSEAKK